MQPTQGRGNSIIVGGRRWPIDAKVHGWAETGLHFTGPTLRKRLKTSMVCLHWTGAENPPSAVHANMTREKLSCHFVIDSSGEIYQMCDTALMCAHAQGVNNRSVGIEIINRGDNPAPQRAIVREVLIDQIHGRRIAYCAFLAPQLRAVADLVSVLCTAYQLPMRVPTSQGAVLSTVLPPEQLDVFRGVIGHMHTKAGKRDPGMQLMRMLHALSANDNGESIA